MIGMPTGILSRFFVAGNREKRILQVLFILCKFIAVLNLTTLKKNSI